MFDQMNKDSMVSFTWDIEHWYLVENEMDITFTYKLVDVWYISALFFVMGLLFIVSLNHIYMY